MRIITGLLIIILIQSVIAFSQSTKTGSEVDYIIFLHNRFIEENDLSIEHPEYGKAEYHEILNEFRKEGFIVISEIRPANTDWKKYSVKTIAQVDSLLKLGIRPDHITVIGLSKGGYIAQYVSTFLANPDVNYVFIGCYQDADLTDAPEINFCGNILSIYEKSDFYGVSAVRRVETSKLKVTRFKEIELHTNLKHGFLYKPLPEWIEPCKKWARRIYDFR